MNVTRRSLSNRTIPSLMLSSTVCSTSRVRSTSARATAASARARSAEVARGLGRLLGRGQRLLSLLQLSDEELRRPRHLGDFVLPDG